MGTDDTLFVNTLGSDLCRAHNRSVGSEDTIITADAFQLCKQVLFCFHFFCNTFDDEICFFEFLAFVREYERDTV